MEKNKFETGKAKCICIEDSDESLDDTSETDPLPNFKEAAESLKKHLEKSQKCICTSDGRVKVPNRVSWVDEEGIPPECICEKVNTAGPDFDEISSTSATPAEEPKKKKKSFVQTLKYLVTCACCKESAEPKPEREPELVLEIEEVEASDSGIISLLGRSYSQISRGKEPVILEYDVPDDLPTQANTREVMQDVPVKAKRVPEEKPVRVKTKEVMQEKPPKPKSKEVIQEKPVKPKTKEVPQEKPVKVKSKEVMQEKPPKPKIKEVPQEKPVKVKSKEVMQEKPPKPKIKEVKQDIPVKVKTREVPQCKPPKPKSKEVTPKVSFVKPLPKKKVSLACICTEGALPKYASRSSSRVSTQSSKVKCKCTDPEVTPSGHLLATKCVCGQLTPSEASLASGYTIGSKASKPDCCYPEKSEELIRKIEYQRPSQYSYRRYDEPLRTYGRETPSIRSVYTPSTVSYADSNQYIPEEDDISLIEPGSTYSYRKSTSVIPSSCISETVAGPSQAPTLYQRLVKRFWLESILYRDPYEPPSRVQSAPSYVSNVSLHRPVVKPQVKKPTKSKEKVCRCSKVQLVAVPSQESKQKLEIPKPETSKAEATEQCICVKKSLCKKSKDLISPKMKECHCLEVLYMSKSSSKGEDKVLSKADDKVLSKTPSEVSAGTSKDPSKLENVPTIIVTPAEETEAKLVDEKGSKSSSNSSVVTVIDTHALQVPSVFSRPVDVKKSAEIQEQVASASSAEDPANPPLATDGSGWWDKSKHLIIGSTVVGVGCTALGAYQYFKE